MLGEWHKNKDIKKTKIHHESRGESFVLKHFRNCFHYIINYLPPLETWTVALSRKIPLLSQCILPSSPSFDQLTKSPSSCCFAIVQLDFLGWATTVLAMCCCGLPCQSLITCIVCMVAYFLPNTVPPLLIL